MHKMLLKCVKSILNSEKKWVSLKLLMVSFLNGGEDPFHFALRYCD